MLAIKMPWIFDPPPSFKKEVKTIVNDTPLIFGLYIPLPKGMYILNTDSKLNAASIL